MQFSLEHPFLRPPASAGKILSSLVHTHEDHTSATMSKAYLYVIRHFVDAAKFTETFADASRYERAAGAALIFAGRIKRG